MAVVWSALGAIALVLVGYLVPRIWLKVVERIKGDLQITVLSISSEGPPLQLPPPRGTSLAPTVGDPSTPDDGIAIVSQSVRLTARGHAQRPAIVHRLTPVVLSRGPALDGWYEFPERGGGLDVRLFVADLDVPGQPAFLVSEPRSQAVEPTLSYAFTVSETDVETWELEVISTDGHVRWGLDVHYEVDGKMGVIEVRHDRFELTTLGEHVRVFTDDGGGQWREVPEWRSDMTDDAAYWRNRLAGNIDEDDEPRG